MVSFPYYSHTIPVRIAKDMGMVWEGYHKGVPLLGVPGSTLEIISLYPNSFQLAESNTYLSLLLMRGRASQYVHAVIHAQILTVCEGVCRYIDMQVSI